MTLGGCDQRDVAFLALVVDDDLVGGVGEQRDGIQLAGCQDGRQVNLLLVAEGFDFLHSRLKLGQQGTLVTKRHVDCIGGVCTGKLIYCVDGQRSVQVSKDAQVVDDESVDLEAALFAAENAVRTGNGLHKGVVAHRFVEIDG